jgi:hypothetical protein
MSYHSKHPRSYREAGEVRGGGEGGPNEETNSLAVISEVTAVGSAGWEMVAGSGSTKITAAVRAETLSWQQDMEHGIAPDSLE